MVFTCELRLDGKSHPGARQVDGVAVDQEVLLASDRGAVYLGHAAAVDLANEVAVILAADDPILNACLRSFTN